MVKHLYLIAINRTFGNIDVLFEPASRTKWFYFSEKSPKSVIIKIIKKKNDLKMTSIFCFLSSLFSKPPVFSNCLVSILVLSYCCVLLYEKANNSKHQGHDCFSLLARNDRHTEVSLQFNKKVWIIEEKQLLIYPIMAPWEFSRWFFVRTPAFHTDDEIEA